MLATMFLIMDFLFMKKADTAGIITIFEAAKRQVYKMHCTVQLNLKERLVESQTRLF